MVDDDRNCVPRILKDKTDNPTISLKIDILEGIVQFKEYQNYQLLDRTINTFLNVISQCSAYQSSSQFVQLRLQFSPSQLLLGAANSVFTPSVSCVLLLHNGLKLFLKEYFQCQCYDSKNNRKLFQIQCHPIMCWLVCHSIVKLRKQQQMLPFLLLKGRKIS